jgi:hypothetical protein
MYPPESVRFSSWIHDKSLLARFQIVAIHRPCRLFVSKQIVGRTESLKRTLAKQTVFFNWRSR